MKEHKNVLKDLHRSPQEMEVLSTPYIQDISMIAGKHSLTNTEIRFSKISYQYNQL